MLPILFLIATVLLFNLSHEVEEAEQDDLCDLAVNEYGKLIISFMLRHYNQILQKVSVCRSNKDLNDINTMLEDFAKAWGKNEMYEELKAEVIGLEVTMFDK